MANFAILFLLDACINLAVNHTEVFRIQTIRLWSLDLLEDSINWLNTFGEKQIPFHLTTRLKRGGSKTQAFTSLTTYERWRDSRLQQQMSSPLTIGPLFRRVCPLQDFPALICCVKVCVAEEDLHTLLGPLLWRQPRKGIYCWTLVAGPSSKTETGGHSGPSPWVLLRPRPGEVDKDWNQTKALRSH